MLFTINFNRRSSHFYCLVLQTKIFSTLVFSICYFAYIQVRHLISAQVDWVSVSALLYKHQWITCRKLNQAHKYFFTVRKEYLHGVTLLTSLLVIAGRTFSFPAHHQRSSWICAYSLGSTFPKSGPLSDYFSGKIA